MSSDGRQGPGIWASQLFGGDVIGAVAEVSDRIARLSALSKITSSCVSARPTLPNMSCSRCFGSDGVASAAARSCR